MMSDWASWHLADAKVIIWHTCEPFILSTLKMNTDNVLFHRLHSDQVEGVDWASFWLLPHIQPPQAEIEHLLAFIVVPIASINRRSGMQAVLYQASSLSDN